MILTTGIWSWVLLGRNAGWLPALRWTILTLTVIAAVGLLVSLVWRTRFGRWALTACVALGLVAAVAGPSAYALATIGQPHQGGGPTVGPPSADAHNRNRLMSWFWTDVSSPELDAMLQATHTKWSAAIAGSSSAANLELSSNTAVMAIGGFSGSDPTPTLIEFIDDVHNHQVAYYIVPPSHGPDRGRDRGHADITKWVAANYKPVKVGKATVYDLSAPN
jgi:hypothetical protein